MKRINILLIITIFSSFLFFQITNAQTQLRMNDNASIKTTNIESMKQVNELGSSKPVKILCQPDINWFMNPDCEPDGPSAFLEEMAEFNLSFPEPPLPASTPDFYLTYPNVSYGEVRTQNAPIYGSIEDAIKAKKKNAINRIDASFSYVSYTDETVFEGIRLYMVTPGGWMTANDISRVTPPRFQGLKFTETPLYTFGWILTYLSQTPNVETKRSPGNLIDDYTGHYLKNHEIVWVYSEEIIDDVEWYLIGPDEWVPHYVVARVIPNQEPPKGVNSDRWIDINLYEQTISVYEHSELVFASLIASGLEPFWTRPGLFQIYEKLESTPMRGAFEADRSDAYYLEDVPWTMYFDERRAIHGAYWRANLGFSQSHGCVNMSIGDAQWIYNWAKLGDWVYVWDPSGNTPTDNDLYTAGGA